MKCPQCRSDNPPDTLYCGKCGTKFDPTNQASFTRTLETPPSDLTRGMTFAGRYEIIEELGAGGMGRVYRAHDTKLNEEVALKLIRPEFAADRRTAERFRNELKTARKIRHKNICGMYDFHEDGRTLFLTMEYVSGEDLRGLIHRTKALTVGTAVSIARQIAEGLAEAHKQGVTHRDLKPGNIMIDKDGQAKIMDFGIARVKQEKGVTSEGAVIGTPEYMSPEQVEGKPADARSDIYSLGAILFEMVVGCPPFDGDTPFSIANKHKSEPPPVPKKFVPQLPEALNKAILRCLEKDKGKRYQTAEELAADLSAVEQSLPPTERVLSRARTRTRTSREITVKLTPRKLIVPAAILVGLAALALIGTRSVFKKRTVYPLPVENSFTVISFENLTGDKEQENFQKVIPQLLRTKFEQTDVRYVSTLERLMSLLKQVGKPDADFIDSELGLELARRDGTKALVTGSYSRSGSLYVTTLRVVDVETRTSLATASASGTGVESILTSQIDDLCRQVFPKLGFSQAQMEKSKAPIAAITTSSPEAYKKFVLGEEARRKLEFGEAKKYFEQAIRIDPEFALAYANLAENSIYSGDSTKIPAYLAKAESLSARLPDKERTSIEWTAAFYRGDREGTVALLEGYLRRYPKDANALLWLGTQYRCFVPRYDEATKLYERALALNPSNETVKSDIAFNYILARDYPKALDYARKYFREDSPEYASVLADINFWTGQLDKALEFYNKLPMEGMPWILSYVKQFIYAEKEDWAQALAQLDEFVTVAPTPEVKFHGYLLKAIYESWLGMPGQTAKDILEARRILGEGRATSEERFNQTLIDWTEFWIAHDRDDLTQCRKSLPVWPDRSNQMFFSQVFFKITALSARAALNIKEGRLESVSESLKDMQTLLAGIGPVKMGFSSSSDAERARFLISTIQAEACLAGGDPSKAVATLAGVSVPEPPDFQNTQFDLVYHGPFLKDTLARAYAETGDLGNAILEYERLLKVDPKIGPRGLPHPKYRYRLARLYERKGDKAKAAGEYRRFLEIWRGAEPGEPELVDAKKRLAGL